MQNANHLNPKNSLSIVQPPLYKLIRFYVQGTYCNFSRSLFVGTFLLLYSKSELIKTLNVNIWLSVESVASALSADPIPSESRKTTVTSSPEPRRHLIGDRPIQIPAKTKYYDQRKFL